MFRRLILLILATALLISLAGCVRQDKRVTIRYMAWGNADHFFAAQRYFIRGIVMSGIKG